jgi:hypothetical protein
MAPLAVQIQYHSPLRTSPNLTLPPPPRLMRPLLLALVLTLDPATAAPWYLTPPQHPSLPTPVASAPDWHRSPIDLFLADALATAGLTPSPDAPPHTLVRRLHFTLTGLPPSPEDSHRFVKLATSQGLDAALAAETDSLLDSPHFAIRFARHWLDVARYAESAGRDSNVTFPHAWRYRDYVIDAFASAKPLDRFITEQIAGDLLPHSSPEERAANLTATAFLAFGPKGLNEMDKRQFTLDLIDEQIDALSRALLAQTIACARCHDHLSEPYSMQDYYALAGIFASTQTHFGTWIDSENSTGGTLITLPHLPGQHIPNPPVPPAEIMRLHQQRADLDAEEQAGRDAVQTAIAKGEDPADLFTINDAIRIFWARGRIDGKLATVDEQGQPLPLTMGTTDRAHPLDLPLLERGELAQPGTIVPRRFPVSLSIPDASPPPPGQSGRLQLAAWLTHPDHPLTSRVLANRIFLWIFGVSLTADPDHLDPDLPPPTHQALLDHLALQLVSSGWQLKPLVRELVLSRAWRQSSAHHDAHYQLDPDNRLLWRAQPRRIEAEAIRDAMLVAAGILDPSPRLGSLVSDDPSRQSVALFGFSKTMPHDLDGTTHRSIYLPIVRDRLPDVLDVFDGAEPSLVTGARPTTNVPTQALYLLNSDFVLAQADALATRLLTTADSAPARIDLVFQLCFARPPSPQERQLATDFLTQALHAGAPSEHQAWSDLAHTLFLTPEFRLLD